MYDTSFTSGPVTKKYKKGMNSRMVMTPERKYLCSVSSRKIYDLNGREIATFSHREKRYVHSSKKVLVRVYDSDYGEFVVKGNRLYLEGGYLGKMPIRKLPLIFLLLIFLLIALAIGAHVLDLPHDELPVVPTINIEDNNGNWSAQETIAVLGDVIRPGSSGEYEFKISNVNDSKFCYDFGIVEYYNDKPIDTFPLEYRVRVNNELVGSGDWLPAPELKVNDLMAMEQSECRVTLEWRWLFDGADDDVDTYFGDDGGRYTIQLHLTAETVE